MIGGNIRKLKKCAIPNTSRLEPSCSNTQDLPTASSTTAIDTYEQTEHVLHHEAVETISRNTKLPISTDPLTEVLMSWSNQSGNRSEVNTKVNAFTPVYSNLSKEQSHVEDQLNTFTSTPKKWYDPTTRVGTSSDDVEEKKQFVVRQSISVEVVTAKAPSQSTRPRTVEPVSVSPYAEEAEARRQVASIIIGPWYTELAGAERSAQPNRKLLAYSFQELSETRLGEYIVDFINDSLRMSLLYKIINDSCSPLCSTTDIYS
ncbi:hypothetical protein JTB14_013290 [Gonioctena quinquepunctata]|nr:hypothetical protein JTB14_013290 [Gonioctena quinquepunctata]